MMQIANARSQRETLLSQYQQEVERTQYRAPYVSQEQRAARTAGEMDQQDLADIMNTSKYSGGRFTAEDYDQLRRGLVSYKTRRGLEPR
jgi:hypothetical protein